MRTLIASVLFVCVTLPAFASEFSAKSCERYLQNATYAAAIETLAGNMRYSVEELCTLDRLMDIHITNTQIFNIEKQKDEPHVWITLHYAEHSCQYFIKNEDQTTTKKNCYNTF